MIACCARLLVEFDAVSKICKAKEGDYGCVLQSNAYSASTRYKRL